MVTLYLYIEAGIKHLREHWRVYLRDYLIICGVMLNVLLALLVIYG